MGGSADDVVEVVHEARAALGESPVWNADSETLLWVDIKGSRLHVHDARNGGNRSVPLPAEVGAVALRRRGGLIAATRMGFARLDPATGVLDVLADPEADLPENRFNDGKCDPVGRFLAGTMHDAEISPTGAVYSLAADGGVTRLFGGYVVCNGPAFDPGGRTLYFCDSVGRAILAFDYDPETGTVGDGRHFANYSPEQGFPDGITVDSEGGVWCAHWDGWRLTRFRPDGSVDRVVQMPVPRPTSCAFGGKDLDRLYVTSARTGLDAAVLDTAPFSGALFRVDVGTRGMQPARYDG